MSERPNMGQAQKNDESARAERYRVLLIEVVGFLGAQISLPYTVDLAKRIQAELSEGNDT